MTDVEMKPADKIKAVCAELGLTMAAQFVPFSQSRNAKPREDGKVWRSLNWRVTLEHWPAGKPFNPGNKRRAILTTDYAAGEAHCPAYKTPQRFAPGRGSANVDRQANERRIAYECETGKRAGRASDHALGGDGFHVWASSDKRPLLPELTDVIASLVMDAGVLDAGSFEEWASEYGYDTDSRSAEKTYRACLEIALKLRNGIGEAGLAKLREACQDY